MGDKSESKDQDFKVMSLLFFSEANMLNGCQCVCDLMKERDSRSHSVSPPVSPIPILRRLQGNLENSIPAVCGCAECIISGC